MLTQYDVDMLMRAIQSTGSAPVYYVAHMVEGRETDMLDEHTYKSISKFKVVKINVTNITNAYLEYQKYITNPNNFHVETEDYYYSTTVINKHHFIVPNSYDPAAMKIPSVVYGLVKDTMMDAPVYANGNGISSNFIVEPTPIKPKYTNTLEYGTMNSSEAENAMINGDLNWKYIRLNAPINSDGIFFRYLYSDWYILDIEGFTMVEKPLINVKQNNCYFTNVEDAFSYIEQLEA